MSKLVELESVDARSSFFVESSDVEDSDGVQQASGHFEKEFDKILERVKPFCEAIIKNFDNLSKKPASGSAEFGLSITGEGNLFVVKASGEASVKITLNWNG